jgi:hypothetical protein
MRLSVQRVSPHQTFVVGIAEITPSFNRSVFTLPSLRRIVLKSVLLRALQQENTALFISGAECVRNTTDRRIPTQ